MPIERTISIVKQGEQPKPAAYWRTRPAIERWQHIEQLRAEHHGYTDETRPRLQRVCRIVKQA